MNNRGQITVFLSILTTSMLLLGLTMIEVARIKMGDARTVEATCGAVENVKAAYCRELFDEYHLLAIDKNFGGQGEGKLEQMVQDYLEYTLSGQTDKLAVEQVALSRYAGLLDNDCEGMKKQISDYMKTYMLTNGAKDILEMLTAEDQAGDDSGNAIEQGREESLEECDKWTGRDPREVLGELVKGGILPLVVSDRGLPSEKKIDTENLPSYGVGAENIEEDSTDFQDIEKFESQIKRKNTFGSSEIMGNMYGVAYALETFNSYTVSRSEWPLSCEIEYLICGRDSDMDNLKGVVNRIILHRLPINFAYLVTERKRVAVVEPMAFALALLPGVTYSAAKYLLLGCWAYVETLADVKIMLAGHDIQFMKTDSTWLTDIRNIEELKNIDAQDFKGNDAIGYREYLALLLVENSKYMYYRMADLIQISISMTNDSFLIKNAVCEFSVDVEVSQPAHFIAFIENKGNTNINDDMYRHMCNVSGRY